MTDPRLQIIRMNMESARSSANKLRSVAEDCAQAGRTAQSAQSGIPGYWQGESADAFTQELQAGTAETQSIQREIEALSETLLRVIREFEAAEDRIEAEIAASANNPPDNMIPFNCGEGF